MTIKIIRLSTKTLSEPKSKMATISYFHVIHEILKRFFMKKLPMGFIIIKLCGYMFLSFLTLYGIWEKMNSNKQCPSQYSEFWTNDEISLYGPQLFPLKQSNLLFHPLLRNYSTQVLYKTGRSCWFLHTV